MILRLSALSVALALALATPTPTFAHDLWSNGATVPAWVKASCCGPADAHHLDPSQVHDMGDYYLIDGMTNPIPKAFRGIPNSAILPSQDGDYWVFYRDTPAHDAVNQYSTHAVHQPASESVYCFFIPIGV